MDDDELFMDEDDRVRLSNMSEKEREIEIFKRIEKREMLKTRSRACIFCLCTF